jgi:hypothetical protein
MVALEPGLLGIGLLSLAAPSAPSNSDTPQRGPLCVSDLRLILGSLAAGLPYGIIQRGGRRGDHALRLPFQGLSDAENRTGSSGIPLASPLGHNLALDDHQPGLG